MSESSRVRPAKYLTNKELLAEIGRCKKTFCTFTNTKYSDYQAIVHNLDVVTDEYLEELLERINAKREPDTDPFTVDGLVFRYMTYDHIPLDPDRKRKSRATNQSHAHTNFPPFKHMLLVVAPDGSRSWQEVGRSHWDGDFELGNFSTIKGRMSNRLGKMFMMLVEKYANRANFRNYCVDDTTEALTKRGWLRHDQITERDEVLSCHDGVMKWSPIRSIYRGHYAGKMFHLTSVGFDALVTPGHKFVTHNGIKPVDFLSSQDSVVLMGKLSEEIDGLGYQSEQAVSMTAVNSSRPFYDGLVWCVETLYGSFVVRRNGTSYLTGNSYREDMQGLALTHLSQVGLQFDESKSNNPFAFYTTTLTHCLGGETLILTREHGSVPIETVAEQDVHLLDGNGDWVKCHIYDHGIQLTQLNYFQGGHEKVGIWSTEDHGWVGVNGDTIKTREFTSHQLIADLRPKKDTSDEEAYRKGVVHGLVYGDGSAKPKIKDYHYIRVCSHQEALHPWLSHFHSYPCSERGDPIYCIPRAWAPLKKFPENPGDNLSYLLGFLRGWFAADGCVSKKALATLCGDAAEHAWLKQWGPLVGWHVHGYTVLAKETNYGVRNKISTNMHLKTDSLDTEDFLIPTHAARWGARPEHTRKVRYDWDQLDALRVQGKSWKTIAEIVGGNANSLAAMDCHRRKKSSDRKWRVVASKQPDQSRWEKVYCPVVETTETFALSQGIQSRNCFVRVINLEKKNQLIRDDLMVSMGMSPSYTRQIENEMKQSGLHEPKALPAKRGRKSAAHIAAAAKAAEEEKKDK